MSGPTIFTDCEEWDNSVIDTYATKKVKLENEHITLKFFYLKSILNQGIISTSPYAGDGGVITKNLNNIPFNKDFLDGINTIHRQFKPEYVLIKTRLPLANNEQYSCFYTNYAYYTFILDLTEGLDCIWNEKIKSKTRNQVRKGLKNTLEVRIGYLELMEDFYRVLSTCWRDLGTPIHSIYFFRNILINFKEKSKLMVIYYEKKPVSTALLIMTDNTIHHPFAGTIKIYNNLSINNVLYYKIIEYACLHNIRYFDMGRSKVGQGTYKYKETWGAQPLQLFYYFYELKNKESINLDSSFIKLATNTWKKLPLWVTNNLGKYFIKGSAL